MEMRKIAREKRSPVQKSMEMRKIARERRSHVQKSMEMRKIAREKRSPVQKSMEMREIAREIPFTLKSDVLNKKVNRKKINIEEENECNVYISIPIYLIY